MTTRGPVRVADLTARRGTTAIQPRTHWRTIGLTARLGVLVQSLILATALVTLVLFPDVMPIDLGAGASIAVAALLTLSALVLIVRTATMSLRIVDGDLVLRSWWRTYRVPVREIHAVNAVRYYGKIDDTLFELSMLELWTTGDEVALQATADTRRRTLRLATEVRATLGMPEPVSGLEMLARVTGPPRTGRRLTDVLPELDAFIAHHHSGLEKQHRTTSRTRRRLWCAAGERGTRAAARGAPRTAARSAMAAVDAGTMFLSEGIERVGDAVRAALPPEAVVEVETDPWMSQVRARTSRIELTVTDRSNSGDRWIRFTTPELEHWSRHRVYQLSADEAGAVARALHEGTATIHPASPLRHARLYVPLPDGRVVDFVEPRRATFARWRRRHAPARSRSVRSPRPRTLWSPWTLVLAGLWLAMALTTLISLVVTAESGSRSNSWSEVFFAVMTVAFLVLTVRTARRRTVLSPAVVVVHSLWRSRLLPTAEIEAVRNDAGATWPTLVMRGGEHIPMEYLAAPSRSPAGPASERLRLLCETVAAGGGGIEPLASVLADRGVPMRTGAQPTPGSEAARPVRDTQGDLHFRWVGEVAKRRRLGVALVCLAAAGVALAGQSVWPWATWVFVLGVLAAVAVLLSNHTGLWLDHENLHMRSHWRTRTVRRTDVVRITTTPGRGALLRPTLQLVPHRADGTTVPLPCTGDRPERTDSLGHLLARELGLDAPARDRPREPARDPHGRLSRGRQRGARGPEA